MGVSAGIMGSFLSRIKGNLPVAACVLALTCCPLHGAQTPSAPVQQPEVVSSPTPPAPAPLELPDYIISPDDLLSISLYEAPDVSGEYRVSPTGQISLPMLPAPIMAAGRTPVQLAELVSEAYRKTEVYSHPQVTVGIKESRVHAITIAGAVKVPQIYPVFGKLTLLDILSQAQGVTDDAGNTAVVTRGVIGMEVMKRSEACGSGNRPVTCESTFSVDLSQLTATGNPLLNIELFPGDKVTVQRAGVVYVVGAVNKPGGFALKTGQEDMSVLQALALAEDLKPTAIRQKAMIIRKDPAAPNGRVEIPVDLKKVLAGSERDAQLLPEDVFFVPDSTEKRAFRRGVEAAITAATLAIVYVH